MRKLGTLPSGWLGQIASEDPDDARAYLVPGVRVKFAVVGRQAVREARAACAVALKSSDGDFLAASDALSRELIRGGIAEWEGVGDSDGNVAAVTPETIDLFLADTDLCEAAEQVYVYPWLIRDAEKNGSGVSSDGTSQEGTPESGIVTSAAQPAPVSAAGQTRTPKKRAAHTGNTNPRPKKAKASLKS